MRRGHAHIRAQRTRRTRSRNLARAMAENELAVRHVAEHGIALAPLAGKQLLGQRVLDKPLMARRSGRAPLVRSVPSATIFSYAASESLMFIPLAIMRWRRSSTSRWAILLRFSPESF